VHPKRDQIGQFPKIVAPTPEKGTEMSRRIRIEIAGGVFHVTNRGVDQRNIVCDDEDRREWFRLFHRVAIRHGWKVFAHVLMTNHLHLFLKTPEPNLSSGMHDVESAYATLFNRRHGRTGALFQGRFRPILVESDGHNWSVSRYVHLNPCRVRLASRPEGYRWSTYRFFVDPRGAPDWLDWRTVLCEFGGEEAAARHAYCRHVETGLKEGLTNPLADAFDGMLFGSEQFVSSNRHLIEDCGAEISRRAIPSTIDRVLSIVAEAFEVSISSLQQPGRHGNWARDAAIWLCRQQVRLPLSQIGAAFGGITASAVTDTVRRCEQRQQKISDYRAQCETLRGRGRVFRHWPNDLGLQTRTITANLERSQTRPRDRATSGCPSMTPRVAARVS
jgi:putative transposase